MQIFLLRLKVMLAHYDILANYFVIVVTALLKSKAYAEVKLCLLLFMSAFEIVCCEPKVCKKLVLAKYNWIH